MTVPLSQIAKHAQELESELAAMEQKLKRMLELLADVGIGVAEAKFGSAFHDGGNDVVVAQTGEWIDDHTIIVSASGSKITFIEFGSGVYYNGAVGSSPHPKGAELGMTIGGYGKGKGKQEVWAFIDDDGSIVRTHGNPPALAMWDAAQQMREQITTIARSVFM